LFALLFTQRNALFLEVAPAGNATCMVNSGMQPLIRSSYKGIRFTVELSEEPDIFYIKFAMCGVECVSKAKTRLGGMAVKRARAVIDRKLRENLAAIAAGRRPAARQSRA
jgi:hypothetical protein